MVKVPNNRDPKRIWGKGTKDDASLFLYVRSQISISFKFLSCVKIIIIHNIPPKIDTSCFLYYTMVENRQKSSILCICRINDEYCKQWDIEEENCYG